MTDFERIIRFRPAYDKRHPDPAKNYGVHGVDLVCTLKGPNGAISFVLFTHWMLPNVSPTNIQPTPSGVDYHSPVRTNEYEHKNENCEHLDGQICYSDGSALAADDAFRALIEGGSEGLWEYLQGWYDGRFGPEPTP